MSADEYQVGSPAGARTRNLAKRFMKPRLTFSVVSYLAIACTVGVIAGLLGEDQILNDFPDLTRDDIRAVLAFAAARERGLANSVA